MGTNQTTDTPSPRRVTRRAGFGALAGGLISTALGPAAARATAPRQATPGIAAGTPAAIGSGYQIEGYPPYGPYPAPRLSVIARGSHTVQLDTRLGPVGAPAAPTRIVALNVEACEVLISLGLVPVGVAHYETAGGLPDAYRDLAPEMAVLPTLEASPPDPEQVLALEPDLIFGDAYLAPEQYAPYQAIAPTVVPLGPGSPGVNWQQLTRDTGAAFGREEQSAAVLADFAAQTQALASAAHRVIPAGSIVETVYFFPDAIYLYAVGYEVDGIFWPVNQWVWEYMGFQPGPATRGIPLNEFYAQLSLETVPELAADFLLVFPGGYDAKPSSLYEETIASPLWQANPAVQAGRAFALNLEVALGYYTNLALMTSFRDQIGAG